MEQTVSVRVGVIGPSWWFDYWHHPAIRNHPSAKLTAISGTRERSGREPLEKYGEDVLIYTDYERMLTEAPIDGVIVCTPNDLHHPAAMAALRHGKHVTCEKPIALHAGQAREMADLADRNGLLGMCNFPYRDNPAVAQFRELIRAGSIGTLLHIRGDYHGGFGLDRPPGWRGLRSRSGPGILGDLGSHLIDLIRYVTGEEFRSVVASSLTLMRDPATGGLIELTRTEDERNGDRNDDSCAFLAELGSGAQAVLHASWVAQQGPLGQFQEIEAYGTKGRIYFKADYSASLLKVMERGAGGWREIWTNQIPSGSQGLSHESLSEDLFRPGRFSPTNTTWRWIEAIRSGASEISPNLEDAKRSQQVIDAVVESSYNRRWIEVPAD